MDGCGHRYVSPAQALIPEIIPCMPKKIGDEKYSKYCKTKQPARPRHVGSRRQCQECHDMVEQLEEHLFQPILTRDSWQKLSRKRNVLPPTEKFPTIMFF